MNHQRARAASLFVALSATVFAVTCSAATPWNLRALSRAPKIWNTPEHSSGEVKALFYESVPYKGRPTRVFAYYGIPDVQPGASVPAMVLVHGGGGSAFVPWVKLWVERGYAAISMDTCGSISSGGYNNHTRHEHGGPPGWGGFGEVNAPVEDQWTYHAVADVILAHSLVRRMPGVDKTRVGITGVSWGGYLTCIVAGVDTRFRFASPVYGCGFLGDNSTWVGTLAQMGGAKRRRWLELWDPSVYLSNARMPMLWVTGTNDFAYPMDSLQKSYRLPRGDRHVSLRVRMPHGHGGPGEKPPEILALADALFRGGAPLARFTGTPTASGRNLRMRYRSRVAIRKAELNFTTDGGSWKERKWQTRLASVDAANKSVSAVLPENVMVYYLNIIDDRGLIVSSEHVEVKPRH